MSEVKWMRIIKPVLVFTAGIVQRDFRNQILTIWPCAAHRYEPLLEEYFKGIFDLY